MSRSVGAILATVGTVALVATGVGAVAGLALFGTTAGLSVGGIGLGTLLTASAALSAAGSFFSSLGQRAPKPETTETSIKSPLPPRIDAFGQSRLYGASVLFETAQDGTTVDVYAFCEGPADAITATYLNDDLVTVSGNTVAAGADKRYQSGHVKVGWNLGAAVETAFGAVIAKVPGIWTSAHRGDGVVTGYLLKAPVKDKYFLETYPQGDQVQLSLVGRWKKVYDPRDPAQSPYQPSTWKWSDNAALGLIWYLMVRRSYDWNERFANTLPLTLAAINDCDATMALASGGSEKRYRTALSYRLTDQPSAIIASFLACFDGWFALNDAGEVLLYSGRYYPPTVRLGPDEIAAFSHASGTQIEDATNEITVQYVSAAHDWKMVDAQSWRDEDAITRSGKEPNTADLGAMVPSFTQGRRLAKRMMARANAPDRMTITTTYSGAIVVGHRYANVHLEEAGAVFYSGPVEIVTPPERDIATGGVTFQCVSVDPNIDAWNPATEDGEGAPVGSRVAPEPVATPSITAASAVYSTSTSDGSVAGTGVRISITATAPASEGVTWYARWRVKGSSAWNEQQYPDEDPGPSVILLTGFVPAQQTVEVEVQYRLASGQLSDWSAPFEVETDGSPADPPTIAAGLINTSKPSVALMIEAATEAGASTITITAHDRIYSDKTVAVDAGSMSDLEPGSYYAIFYDDPERDGGSVTYMASTNPDDAVLSTAHPYRHYVGFANTPGEGQPPSGGGGATGPGGSGIGQQQQQ